jgi:beta-phosphoglucomutase-like phosphatase (HAD superfamily)
MVEAVTIRRHDFDAAIFDLDGVLTKTTRIHAAAWKATFDAFLQRWARRHGLTFQPFDVAADYLDYVDGRPRDDGVRSFLAARGIYLPEGSKHDPEDADTVHALGEHKTRLFLQALQKGIDAAAGAKALLKKLRQAGIKTAVGSSSKNAGTILHAAGLEGRFDICVDGIEAEALKLPGKPDPALFLEIARRLKTQPSRAVRGCIGRSRSRQTGKIRMRGWYRSRPAVSHAISTRRQCRHQRLARGGCADSLVSLLLDATEIGALVLALKIYAVQRCGERSEFDANNTPSRRVRRHHFAGLAPRRHYPGHAEPSRGWNRRAAVP